MVQDTVEWFGDYSTNIERSVNAPPTVSITSPANGASFGVPVSIPITANASDTEGTITEVWLYQGTTLIGFDDTSPYTVYWPCYNPDTYSLIAVAWENNGATATSSPVNITVSANSPPTRSYYYSNKRREIHTPASIPISANASDSDGTISRVDFFQGVNLVGSDTAAPHSIVWNNVSSGSYSLTARATDSSGTVATSGAISVNVNQNQENLGHVETFNLCPKTVGNSHVMPDFIFT